MGTEKNIRLLIIAANALSLTANNGKTYRSFISDMPPECVAQFYTGTNENPDMDSCKSYFRITDFDLIKSCIKCKRPVNTHYKLIASLNKTDGPQTFKESKIVSCLKRNSKNLSFVREAIWGLRKWDTKELNEWIQEFKPTHIFAILGNDAFMHKIAREISHRYKLPLSVYFTDDYVLSDNSTNYLQKLHLKWVRRVYRKTLSDSLLSKAFVIGERMKEAYENYFGRRFDILVNGINFLFSEVEPLRFNNDDEIIISFIGGIHLNRWRTISKLGRILKSTGLKYKLQVFCVKQPEKDVLDEFLASGVSYMGALNPEGVRTQTQKCHILLHVESFDTVNRLYTKFSISTKIPEYMAAKRGIIAFGPHEIASIRIFRDNGFGCVLTDMDSDETIKKNLIEYISNYNNIDFDRQYQYALNNFNQANMQLSKLLTDGIESQMPMNHQFTPPIQRPQRCLIINKLRHAPSYIDERRAA